MICSRVSHQAKNTLKSSTFSAYPVIVVVKNLSDKRWQWYSVPYEDGWVSANEY